MADQPIRNEARISPISLLSPWADSFLVKRPKFLSNQVVRRFRRAVASALAFALISPTACAASASNPPIEPPYGKAWRLAFDVEFEGSTLDAAKLSPCFDWNAGDCTNSFNTGKERYLPSQVQLGDGVARLVAEPLSPPYANSACYEGSCTYKSGLLSTARPDPASSYLFKFTYGYVESRMKLPKTQGMFTAFWMVPADPSYQYRSEIDILENLGGKPDVIHQTYHYDNRSKNYKVNDVVQETNGACPKIDYSSDFHSYGVDWQPDHIAWYIDGTECGRFTATDSSQIESGPMQIILNLMVDIKWQREVNLLLPSQTATDHLDVDYLRVWQAQ